ncbi:MAG: hypothetical protein PHT73_02090 [bacterium]|nr:hypothetical protein [bacterium]
MIFKRFETAGQCLRIFLTVAGIAFLMPEKLYAWGGAEHSAITAAALQIMPAAILPWLGAEAYRLIKIYCNYPDFNWARYGEIIRSGQGFVRLPDMRRDWNAPFYCGFDEATGKGDYYLHGTQLSLNKMDIAPDEHVRMALEGGRFSEEAAVRAFGKSLQSFRQGNLRDGARFAGVMCHYIEDATPPPHYMYPLPVGELHHAMERIKDRDQVSIDAYKPSVIADDADKAAGAVIDRMKTLSCFAHEKSAVVYGLVKNGKQAEADAVTLQCAVRAAEVAADVLMTLFTLVGSNLPALRQTPLNVELLHNRSFDEDEEGQGYPDSWLKEVNDEGALNFMHIWNRYTARNGGSCAKLQETTEKGACWRTPWACSVLTEPGQVYELTGYIRGESATGDNYIALIFFDKEMNLIFEARSDSVCGSVCWQEVRVYATVPVDAEDMLVGCYSRHNEGAVLFDDLSLVRVS